MSDLEDLNDKKMGLALRNPHYQLGVEVTHTHTHTLTNILTRQYPST